MILGIGNDIVDISRFNNVLNRKSSSFLSKYFLPSEIVHANAHKVKFIEKIASAWAVKEATAKALGTGIAMGVRLQDIELLRNASGSPSVRLHNHAHTVAKQLANGGEYCIFVTVSHDAHMVCAMVILQKQK